jgi:hypothetical protein
VPPLKDNPFRNVANNSQHPLLLTLQSDGRRRWWFLDGPTQDFDPAEFGPCRRNSSYQHRRSYAGLYPFGTNYHMVAFESLVELICLMELDHGGEVAAVSAQPFGLVFQDQTLHYPDFAARLHDGRIVVIDVKPGDLATADSFAHKAVLTEEACSTQRWEYRVMHGSLGWQAANLEWICAFRYDEYLPKTEAAKDVLGYLCEPHTMDDAALRIDSRAELGVGYALLSNMLFNRQVVPLEPGPFYPGLMVIAGAEKGEGSKNVC